MNVNPDSTCQRKPKPCASRDEMRELHGKPMDFERAVRRYVAAWTRGHCG